MKQDIRDIKVITSIHNPLLRETISLQNNKTRKKQSIFGVEGAREIIRAMSCGYELKRFFYCPEKLSDLGSQALKQARNKFHVDFIEISQQAFAKLVMRKDSDGIYAVFVKKSFSFADIQSQNFFLLAVFGIEKPGNLGAIMRSADGAGVDGIVVIDGSADIYHPHVIRASLGTVFAKPAVLATASQFLEFCRSNGIKIYAAALSENSICYDEPNYGAGVAIVLGSEAHGLPASFLEQITQAIKIPMLGMADSLNVSVAASVLAYEVIRQRRSLV